MQIQTEMSDGSKSAGLFSKPIQILTFIKQALDTALTARPQVPLPTKQKTSTGDLRLSDLRLNVTVEEDPYSDGDSDDDLDDSEAFTADDEMKETTITLLLSVLEGKDHAF